MSAIWLPGRGVVNQQAKRVDRAVHEYDERLFFGEWHGDFVVYMTMPHGTDPLPILNFGREMPTPDTAIERLSLSDARKRGAEILQDLIRHNNSVESKYEEAASEGAGLAAEAVESFNHRIGNTPYHRSLPKRDPRQRAG